MPERPNIVFILTDQFRWDCLSWTGHPVVETPNLDEIARKGVTFTNAYSSCPSCIAARASIFTGKTPSTTGRLGYADRVTWRYDNMLPQVLGDAGYQTHCVGKTHFYPQRAHLGFHSMDSYEAGQNFDGTYVNDYHEWLREQTNGRLSEWDNGLPSNSWNARPSVLPEELHNNSWVVTKGLEFVRRRDKTRPFFLNLSFHRPHAPLDPPQAFYDMYKDRELPPVPVGDWADENNVPIERLCAARGVLPKRTLDHGRRAYYAQIAHIDCQIGRFVRTMAGSSSRPTVYLFTSDHGEMIGDHHMYRKCYAYEGSAGVPMIVSLPNSAKGAMCDAPVVLEDVYPTLLEAAGVPIPRGVEAHSMVPLSQDPVGAPRQDYVHGEHASAYHEDNGNQFLTDGKEKYVWFPLSGREQFFDMREDPNELRNLAEDPAHRERVELWRRRMVEELAPREQDGLSDGKRLISGKGLPQVRPELLDDADRPEEAR